MKRSAAVKQGSTKRARTEPSDGKAAEVAKDFVHFMRGCPSQFHAVQQAIAILTKAGFVKVAEGHQQAFRPGGRYFFTRNQSAICAFAVGHKWKPGNGFNIMGAHTDSPVLKVKPVSKAGGAGFEQLGVECYGGGLWHTWFDRDLSLAGRVIVADGKGGFESKLVDLEDPVLRIPMLAIHLNRDIYTSGLKPNKQSHLAPVMASAVESALSKSDDGQPHPDLLMDLVAAKLGCKKAAIRELELCLYDTQPARIGGARNDFVYARGLDNLCMSYVCLRALVDSVKDSASFKNETQIRTVCLFDNEEVGSRTAHGAGGSMLPELLKTMNQDTKSMPAAIRKSFMVSADMAHALHPNYQDKHEPKHRPLLNKGLVVKQNANQKYATTAITSFLLAEIARRHALPTQQFVTRNDMGCGSTIGPILSTRTGIRTIDVGIPQLSMHSIREMCGVVDIATSLQLLTSFFKEFAALDASLKSD